MSHVLILGANGQIARPVTEKLLRDTDHHLSLFLRNAQRLQITDDRREEIIEGDVNDTQSLAEAMQNIDIVYSNVGGTDLEQQSQSIVEAMKEANVERLIFVSALGAHNEVPGKFGEWNQNILGDILVQHRKAAAVIEASDLDYTILRPAWLTNKDEVEYETTQKNEPFKGTEVSRESVADYICRLIENPLSATRQSIGLNKPGTDGDKPAFI